MPKVLITDALSPRAVEIFRARGIEADVEIGLAAAELRRNPMIREAYLGEMKVD